MQISEFEAIQILNKASIKSNTKVLEHILTLTFKARQISVIRCASEPASDLWCMDELQHMRTWYLITFGLIKKNQVQSVAADAEIHLSLVR